MALSKEKQAVKELLKLPENKYCVDCGGKGELRPIVLTAIPELKYPFYLPHHSANMGFHQFRSVHVP